MEISLTDFVDFTLASGPSKVTKVRELKRRPDYDPATDLWKPMREGIVDLHRRGPIERKALDTITAAQTHALKQRLYPGAAAGYMKFLGRRPQDFVQPPRGVWKAGGLEVKVNPEVGLRIGGKLTIIKLHFKREDLSKQRIQASIGVMTAELGVGVAPGTQFGVLDVKAGKLLLADGRWNAADTQILIQGEARSFVAIWDAV